MKKIYNNWIKVGQILRPKKKYNWSKSHMSLPTPLVFKNYVRIYYGTRDIKNRSRISFLDFDPVKKKNYIFS